jgi:hypothetical protein
LVLAVIPVAIALAGTRSTTLFDGHSGFQVRPGWIALGADGAVIFGGGKRQGKPFGHIRWQRWGKPNASGTGIEWVNNCSPDCAQGTYQNRGVIKLQGWRAVPHHFTRLTVNGPHIHQTLVLEHNRYAWYWN